MNDLYQKNKLFFWILGILAVGFLVWYFSSIIICVIIAGVLSIIGQPLVTRLDSISVRRIKIPHVVSVVLVLMLMIIVFLGFLAFLVPLVIKEVNMISGIDTQKLADFFWWELNRIQEFLRDYGIIAKEDTIINLVKEYVMKLMNVGLVTGFLGNIFSFAGLFFFYFFTVLFLAFFFLKDPLMLPRFLLLLIPEKYLEQAKNVMNSTRRSLNRYFSGLLLEMLALSLLVSFGLMIIGIPGAFAIGFFAGIMNIVPYIGYLIASVVGVILAVTGVLSAGEYQVILPVVLKTLLVLVVANMIDNSLFQPYFFGKSVNAHPLEIFLVIIAAGFIGGIAGMIVAVPAYTILRIIAREFFSQLRVVRKLTDQIE